MLRLWEFQADYRPTECVTVTRLILCKSWRNHQSSSTGLLPLLNCNEDLTFNSSAQSFLVTLFFVPREHFVLKCKLCVFSCHLNDEKGVQTDENWRPNYQQSWELSMALSAHHQTFIFSARRFPTDILRERERERERRGAEEERPVCIVSTEGGAATGSK